MVRIQERRTRSPGPMALVVIGCALFWLGFQVGRFEKTAMQYITQSITAETQQPKFTNTSTQLQTSHSTAMQSIPAETQQPKLKSETNTFTQLQLSHATDYDRYPDQYSCVKKYIALQERNHTDPLSILSFGSSTGREAKALADIYFNSPDDIIYGVDLDDETLSKARQFTSEVLPKGKITFFNGKKTPVTDFGPYDAIFANSVLCLHPPPSHNADKFMKIFPFDNFDKAVRELDQVLKKGGLIQIVNANYDFRQSAIGKKYRELPCDCRGPTHFVPMIDLETTSFRKELPIYCIFVKNI